jgi:hypothetical protein
MYSFGWLCEIDLVFSGLRFYASRNSAVSDSPWFLGLAFALALGAGMAALASLGFLLKAAKARYFGPNPRWNPQPDEHAAV